MVVVVVVSCSWMWVLGKLMSYFRARTKGMHVNTPLGILLSGVLSRTMVCRHQAAGA